MVEPLVEPELLRCRYLVEIDLYGNISSVEMTFQDLSNRQHLEAGHEETLVNTMG